MVASYHRDRLVEDLRKYLEKYLDPLSTLNSNDYLELTRLLIKLHLANKQDFHKTLKVLVEISVDAIKGMYENEAKRKAIKEKLHTVTRSRLELYKDWLTVGIQIVGLEAPAILAKDPVLQILLGAILKLALITAAEVQRYTSYRYIRKVAVAVEELSRRFEEEFARELTRLGDRLLLALERIREEIWKEEVFLNTPEVIALADKLRRLREDVLHSI